MDFCAPDATARLPQRYSLIISGDTVEHVADPATFFANVYRALAPGGQCFITFPNEHPTRAHGITCFSNRRDLQDVLHAAGFAREDIRIDTVRLKRGPACLLHLGWQMPRRFGKRFWKCWQDRPAPQTFEHTQFFRAAARLGHLAPLINSYCWTLMKLAASANPVHEIRPAPEIIWDRSILVRASKPGTGWKSPATAASSNN